MNQTTTQKDSRILALGLPFSSYFFILLLFLSCHSLAQENKKNAAQNYIFFLHNRYLEGRELDDPHKEYGKAEYAEILGFFRKENFVVLSEKRPKDTDTKEYAQKVKNQIDSLLKIGITANHITVIGTSKGGYIAQYISTFLANPDINYVFIGCFQENDLTQLPEIQFCGNILTIYEKSDVLGASAIKRKEASKLKINHFREIELHTGLKHGFLYKALPEWMEPCKKWARREYNF